MERRLQGALAGKRWPLIVVFAAIVAVQVAVAALSIDVLSAVRAYVNGESLYSKGQKDAHTRLLGYLERRREDDFEAFLRALAVPLGDRLAREALQRPQPDLEAARLGFLAGGNHPDDIDGMVRLFRYFQAVPFMASAIATWTEGDQLVGQVNALGWMARRQVAAGADDSVLEPIRHQAHDLNERLGALETRFSEQLGVASRNTQALLIGLNIGLAVLLCVTGLNFVRRSAREQAHTEEALRRREESLQQLLDSAAEGLYGVDLQGRCTFINRAALQMLGYAHESDLLGHDSRALLHHGAAGGGQSAPELQIFEAAGQNKQVHLTRAELRRRDGTPFPVECWSHPVVEGGVTRGAVVTFVDISQRLKMQAALRAGELRVRQLVEAVSEAVITLDADDRVVFFNRAAESTFGVRSHDVLRTRFERLVVTQTGRAARVDTLVGSVVELVGIRAGGGHFPVEASVSRIETEDGAWVTIVLRDVTEQHAVREERRAREAHEAASRAKTEFLSRMSHELRTPLNAVLGFSHLLRLDTRRPLTLQQLERVQHIENAGGHLLALVNDVLDLSRVESGQMAVSLEPVDLSPVVLESFGMVTSLAAEHDVQLLVDTDADGLKTPSELAGHACTGPWVVGDAVRLRQVIVNLLSNAVKYNHRGGRVTLSYRVDRETCVLRFSDTGVGMSAKQLARLFEPFNRLGAEKTNVEGVGIGLVLSRRLTELMGGTLAIESEPGYGTTATLTFHLSTMMAADAGAAETPSQSPSSVEQVDVLYVEDDPVNAELVRQVLHLRPATTLRVVESGQQALREARARRPDLMLIDMNLGDMNGVQLAQQLRRDAATRHVPLVALSADALPEQIERAMASGFERYLTKPVDFHELLRVVDGCVAEEARSA